MQKYIHYCWFGGKPLSKLTLKCLKSWQKYLPDYEIKRWDETNCDINECSFVKEAYENKKWAFVADYFRTKALYQYGGIYFDTDMEVIKDITPLLNDDTFLGLEDSGFVAVGVWYEKKAKAILPGKLLKKYQSFSHFDLANINKLSIPIQLTEILKEYKVEENSSIIQRLDNDIIIYPRDYFYPLSMDRSNNIFTDNTYMVHYYDATWISKKQKLELFLVRHLGKSKTIKLETLYQKTKYSFIKVVKFVLFPLVLYRKKKKQRSLLTTEYYERIRCTLKTLDCMQNKNYITIFNSSWIGVSNATIELFENLVDCGEIYLATDIKKLGDKILDIKVPQVIFSSFAIGWKDLAKYLKKRNPSIKIKTFWHGSHSQILDSYGWDRNLEIIDLHRKKIIDVMGTCKQSLMQFYVKQGFNAAFLTNKVEVNIKPTKKRTNSKIIVGLYAANCNDWRKNMYTQIAAVSLIDKAVIDMVPLNDDAISFANKLGVEIQGVKTPLSRIDLIKRMAKVDIVSYVTLSECSPMLPLESMEMGVPCLSGNNHHYFKENELEKYIIVNEEDNPLVIKEKIVKCLKDKEKIMDLYFEFSKENIKNSNNDVQNFLKM